jgi:peptidoglycan-N-acetylglucosamine deacetylase
MRTVALYFAAVLSLLLVVAAALWTGPRWLVPRIARQSPGCLYHVPTSERAVALTLDDGPDPVHTPEILQLLRAHEARATFFLISGNVAGREALVADVVTAGHEIGNHLTRDESSVRLSPAAFERAAGEAGAVLARFAPVRWLRPGGGFYNGTMLETIGRLGYDCSLGSVYPYDAHLASVRLASAYVLANARPGSVIVLHEGGARGRRTVATLRRVLPALRARGYRVVTLSELEQLRSEK